MAKRMRETPHKGKKTGSRKKKIALIVTTVVLALVIAGGTAVYVLLHSNLFGGADMSEYGNSQAVQEKSVNILIVGTDNDTSRPEYADHELTDVIMVVNFNMEDGTAHILQIPRDTYVGDDIPSGKINAVFSRGENKDKHILNLVNYITTQYQLPIDHYITITMQTFIDAVDAIGGIEMNVPYDVTIVDEGLEIKAGQQTLSGQQAQCFVRSRELYAEGDLGRVKAQRLFIAAGMEKITKLSTNEMIKLVGLCYDKVETDLTGADILNYAQKASKLDLSQVEMYMVPGEPAYSKAGLSIYSVHKEELANLLNEKFRPHTEAVPAEKLTCPEVANSSSWYDKNGNTIDDLLGGAKPGKDTISGKESSSSAASSSATSGE